MGGVRRIELLSLEREIFVLISSRGCKSGRTIWICPGLFINQFVWNPFLYILVQGRIEICNIININLKRYFK